MSALVDLLAARIRAEGPMTVADFMAECLGNPRHGYYATRDPLGAAGDFVTAPEVSQMFGEMVGLWLAQAWADAGRPSPVRLVELGPGRGTLMADALRAAVRTGLPEAAELWLVETSPALRAEQARRLPGARWAADLSEVPEGPLLLVANEFFDALPVRQFLAGPEGWRERLVGLSDGRLVFGLSDPLPGEAPPEAWRELCPSGERIAAEAAARIARDGGAALVIDYGYGDAQAAPAAPPRPPGPTLQALKAHAAADPLEAPGEADLTVLVDFGALARTFREAGLGTATAPQGAFLARLGIGLRAAALARAEAEQADAVADALERLTGDDAMGRHFTVLAAWPAAVPQPPGFGEAP